MKSKEDVRLMIAARNALIGRLEHQLAVRNFVQADAINQTIAEVLNEIRVLYLVLEERPPNA